MAPPGNVVSSDDRFLTAAIIVAAELQVSRASEQRPLEAYIFKFPAAANSQATGWRRGRQLSMVSFLDSAAAYNGVKVGGLTAVRNGWGAYGGSWAGSPDVSGTCPFPPEALQGVVLAPGELCGTRPFLPLACMR